jgi:uncharacterized protein YjbJ (UPF0337 family)
MDLLAIPRTVVSTSLKLVRLPLEQALKLATGSNGAADENSIRATADRADAAAREVAGKATGDDQLQRTATRRRRAADQRDEAATRRRQADERKQQAERRRATGRRQAQQKRSQASRRAQRERSAAEEERRTRERRAEEVAEKRETEAREAAEATQAQVAAREQRARLEQLDSEADAIEKRKDALTASDEADRLKAAAENAKEARRDE